MKPVTSNLAYSWSLPKPIIISHQKTKWVWPWAKGAPQNLGLPFDISATAEKSIFRISTLLGFAKSHHKIPMALYYRSSSKFWGSPPL